MASLYLPLFLAGFVPLFVAWNACRPTSLAHTTLWLAAAWIAWGGALLLGDRDAVSWEPLRYVAFALNAGAVVAALGARHPYVGAWNFVVLGLLAVTLLPLFEMLVLGSKTLDGLRLFFLGATLAIGVLNYLPTRFFPAALWTGAVLGLEFCVFALPGDVVPDLPLTWLHAALFLSPWIAWLSTCRGRRRRTQADLVWLDFRDRYGLVWGQRLREQFNSAARNAGLSTSLTWWGMTGNESPPASDPALELLRALLKRFMPAQSRSTHFD